MGWLRARGRRAMGTVRSLRCVLEERLKRCGTLTSRAMSKYVTCVYNTLFGRQPHPNDEAEWVYFMPWPQAESTESQWRKEEEVNLACEVLRKKLISAQQNRYDRFGRLIVDWRSVASLLNSQFKMCDESFTPQICRDKYEELTKKYAPSLLINVLEMRPNWNNELFQSHMLVYQLSG